jgi:hypothetical protein
VYKLKEKDGQVCALYKAGKDYVRTAISVASAQHIIDTQEIVESIFLDYPLATAGGWNFEAVKVKERKKKTEDETDEQV